MYVRYVEKVSLSTTVMNSVMNSNELSNELNSNIILSPIIVNK